MTPSLERKDALVILNCLFLVVPLFLYVGFWMQWYISVPCLGALGWACWQQFRQLPRVERIPCSYWWTMLAVFVVANVVVFFSGVGYLWSQSGDFLARNWCFEFAVSKPWPVHNSTDDHLIVYPLLYWLPVAGLGKLVGLATAKLLLHLYVSVQLTLGALLFLRRINTTAWWGVALLFLGALIPLGYLFPLEILPIIYKPLGLVYISGSYTTLSGIWYAFNSFVPVLVLTLLLMGRELNPRIAGLLLLLGFLYMPFSIFGLGLIIGLRFLEESKGNGLKTAICQHVSCANVAVGVLGLGFYIFFTTTPVSSSGLELAPMSWMKYSILYYLVMCVGFGALYLWLFPRCRLVWAMFALMVVLPWFWTAGAIGGCTNDLCTKGLLVPLIVILVKLGQLLQGQPWNRRKLVAICLCVAMLPDAGYHVYGFIISNWGRPEPIIQKDFSKWDNPKTGYVAPYDKIPAWLIRY